MQRQTTTTTTTTTTTKNNKQKQKKKNLFGRCYTLPEYRFLVPLRDFRIDSKQIQEGRKPVEA